MADPERGQVPLSEQCRGLATKAAETEADLAAKTAQLDALKAYNNKLITTFGELVTCTNEMIEALTDPQQQQKFAALLKRIQSKVAAAKKTWGDAVAGQQAPPAFRCEWCSRCTARAAHATEGDQTSSSGGQQCCCSAVAVLYDTAISDCGSSASGRLCVNLTVP